ncbi:MAG: hypothetical protein ACI8ZB_004537 [Desulforhopalus sp.]|jgi:hypothetical protein
MARPSPFRISVIGIAFNVWSGQYCRTSQTHASEKIFDEKKYYAYFTSLPKIHLFLFLTIRAGIIF